MYIIIIFFSSRRRHTIFSRDWSSDVCSSDLACCTLSRTMRDVNSESITPAPLASQVAAIRSAVTCAGGNWPTPFEIGRASCREREYITVVGDAVYDLCVHTNIYLRSKSLYIY